MKTTAGCSFWRIECEGRDQWAKYKGTDKIRHGEIFGGSPSVSSFEFELRKMRSESQELGREGNGNEGGSEAQSRK
jgi:hypothetical protein